MAVDSLKKTSATQFGYSYLKPQGKIRARDKNLSIVASDAIKAIELDKITPKNTDRTQRTLRG